MVGNSYDGVRMSREFLLYNVVDTLYWLLDVKALRLKVMIELEELKGFWHYLASLKFKDLVKYVMILNLLFNLFKCRLTYVLFITTCIIFISFLF